MADLVRLICEYNPDKPDHGERKVFDVPRNEVRNLKYRLEQKGWEVTVEYL